MSRLGMLIRVTARAVLSIEWGGQFCGPGVRGALRCDADHRRRPSDPRRSYSLSGCLERLDRGN